MGKLKNISKNILFVYALFSEISANVFSANIILDPTFNITYPDTAIFVTPDTTVDFAGYIYNLSSDSLHLAVVRTINDLPSGWYSSICLDSLCLLQTVDSTTVDLGQGDSVKYGLLITANSTGYGHIQLDFFDQGNENDHIFVNINIYSGSTVSITNGELLPAQSHLYQNYPNPFNPVTTLRFDLRSDTFVNIIIYDMMGQTVRTLVNENHSAGLKSIRWNATDDNGSPVPAGIYFYTLQTSGLAANSGYRFFKTRKMVLLK